MNNDSAPPSFELPTPQSSGAIEAAPQAEPVPASPETAPIPAQAAPIATAPIAADPVAQAAPVQPVTVASATQTANDLKAEEGDLIEKEWVQKAKQIIAATRDDPHTQTREMSRMKADYLKKRYNKDIKVEES